MSDDGKIDDEDFVNPLASQQSYEGQGSTLIPASGESPCKNSPGAAAVGVDAKLREPEPEPESPKFAPRILSDDELRKEMLDVVRGVGQTPLAGAQASGTFIAAIFKEIKRAGDEARERRKSESPYIDPLSITGTWSGGGSAFGRTRLNIETEASIPLSVDVPSLEPVAPTISEEDFFIYSERILGLPMQGNSLRELWRQLSGTSGSDKIIEQQLYRWWIQNGVQVEPNVAALDELPGRLCRTLRLRALFSSTRAALLSQMPRGTGDESSRMSRSSLSRDSRTEDAPSPMSPSGRKSPTGNASLVPGLEQLEKLYKCCDLDGSGRITMGDLARIALDLGLLMSKVELRQLLRELDLSHANRVGFVEFEAWWEADKDKTWYSSAPLRRRIRLCGVLATSQRSVLEILRTATSISCSPRLEVEIDDALHAMMAGGTRRQFVALFHDGVDPTAQLGTHVPRDINGKASTDPTRLALAELTSSTFFEISIILVILLNTIILIVAGDSSNDDDLLQILRYVNTMVNLIFTAEVIMEIVAFTLISTPHSYLRSSLWNVFDFVLMISVWILWFIAEAVAPEYERACFALTAFRAVHCLRYHSGISEIIEAIAHGKGTLKMVLELIMMGALIFAVLGRELFAGAISRFCADDVGVEVGSAAWKSLVEEQLQGVNYSSSTDQGICPLSFECEICVELLPQAGSRTRTLHWDKIGFDSIGKSLLTVFSVTALDEWATIAEPIMRSTSSTAGLVWLFCAMVVVVLNVIGVNLLLAAVTFSYMAIRTTKHSADGMHSAYVLLVKALLSDTKPLFRKKGVFKQVSVDTFEDEGTPTAASKDKDQWDLEGKSAAVDPIEDRGGSWSQHLMRKSWFNRLVLGTVLVNIVVLACEHFNMDPTMRMAIYVLDAIFTVIYCFEATVKISALGSQGYFEVNLNRLDFFICVSAVAGLAVDAYYGALMTDQGGLKVFRSLRVFRVIRASRAVRVGKLVFRFERTKNMLSMAMASHDAAWSLTFLIIFALLVPAVVAVHLFGDCGVPATRGNFGTFWAASVTNFQILTGDDFASVMYEYMECSGQWAAVYFVIMYFFLAFVLINLFVAIFLENFQLSDELKRQKQIDAYVRKVTAPDHVSVGDIKGVSMMVDMIYAGSSLMKRAVRSDMWNDKTDWLFDEIAIRKRAKEAAAAHRRPSAARGQDILVPLRKRLDSDDPEASIRQDDGTYETQTAFEVESIPSGATTRLGSANVEASQPRGTTSLGMFAETSQVRRVCKTLVEHRLFHICIEMTIVGSGIAIAMEGPTDTGTGSDDELHEILNTLDYVFYAIFLAECLMMIIAYGFYDDDDAYLRSAKSHWFDFSVVIFTTMDLLLRLLDVHASWMTVIRLARVLRLLRLLEEIEGMAAMAEAMGNSMSAVWGLVALLVGSIVMFGIVGVGLFAGEFWTCQLCSSTLLSDGSVSESCRSDIRVSHFDEVDCDASTELSALLDSSSGSWAGSLDGAVASVTQGHLEWRNADFHFDSLPESLRALFICMTRQGWNDIFWIAVDSTEPGFAPQKEEHRFETTIFFVLFILLNAFILEQLFVGLLVDVFSQTSGHALLTQEQKNWQYVQLCVYHFHGNDSPLPTSALAVKCQKILVNKIPMSGTWHTSGEDYNIVQTVVNVVVVLNVGALVINSAAFPLTHEAGFDYFNDFCLLIYTAEVVVKSLAFGASVYARTNSIDLGVIIAMWPTAIHAHLETSSASWLQGLQVVRVFRLVELVESNFRLRKLVQTIRLSVPHAVNLGMLMVLTYFVFGVAAMKLFGIVQLGNPALREMDAVNNFESIYAAMALLFQITTGHPLPNLLMDCELVRGRLLATPFFFLFFVFSNFVFLNLLIALVLENFEYNWSKDFDISEDDVENFKDKWKAAGLEITGGLIDVSEIPKFVEGLQGAFKILVKADAFWFNRLLLELNLEPDDIAGTNARHPGISFHELLLSLSKIRFGTRCLEFEEEVHYEHMLHEKHETDARRVIACFVGAWRARHNPPNWVANDPDPKAALQKWRAAVQTARLWVLRSAILTMRVSNERLWQHRELDDVLVSEYNIRKDTLEKEHAKSHAQHPKEWEDLNSVEDEDDEDEGVVAAAAKAVANGTANTSSDGDQEGGNGNAKKKKKKKQDTVHRIIDGKANTRPNSKGNKVVFSADVLRADGAWASEGVVHFNGLMQFTTSNSPMSVDDGNSAFIGVPLIARYEHSDDVDDC